MSHDFILAKGKIKQKDLLKIMEDCVSYKFSTENLIEGSNLVGVLSVVDDGQHIHDKIIPSKNFSKSKNVEYFHGYAKGIFYDAFDCQKFNRGMSGSGEAIYKYGKQIKRKIETASHKILMSDDFGSKEKIYAKNLLSFCKELKEDEIITVIFC